jgi:hypothetical protein
MIAAAVYPQSFPDIGGFQYERNAVDTLSASHAPARRRMTLLALVAIAAASMARAGGSGDD